VFPFDEDFGNAPLFIDGKYWSATNTVDQNMNARFPRLSKTTSNNNYTMSDFWFIKGSYFRIKNISLGYNVPKIMTDRAKINGLRLYVSLKDFISIHKFPTGWDPEVNAASYPIMKTFIVGAIIKL
jgi:hypothetical protein